MSLTALAIGAQNTMMNLANHVLAIGKVILLSRFRVKLPEVQRDQLTVLANGPTLQEDIKHIDSTVNAYMCVNFFAEVELYTQLKPSYYVLCDPAFFVLDSQHGLYERVMAFYRLVFEKTDWPVSFFIPYPHKKRFLKWITTLELHSKYITFYYYNTTNFEGKSSLIQWLYKRRLGMPSPTSVAVPAMMLGISMGYKRLNVTGVSHNFHQDIVVTQENKLMIRFLHFYDKGEQVSYKPFLKTDHKEGYRISEFFMILHKMFKSYEYVALFAKRRSVTVINYTRDSFIDQFTKYNSN